MSAVTVRQRFEDVDADADATVPEKPQPRLRQILQLTDGFCQLRVHDSGDNANGFVTMTAPSGRVLMEKLQRSRIVDGELLLGLVPKLTTVDDYLQLSVRVPPPKPKPKLPDVDCAADLKELMDAIMEYNSDRDAEWDFVDDHGLDACGWTEEQAEEHDQILADIAKKREWIQGILRRVTGDVTLEF